MDSPVGKILVKAGLLSAEQFNQLQEYQERTGKSAGISVLELGWIPEHILLDCLSQHYGVPKINLRVIQIETAILRMVPAEICRKHLVVPVKRVGPTLMLAMANPEDKTTIENIRFITHLEISIVIATELMIQETLKKYYSGVEFDEVLEEVFTGEEEFAGFQESGPTVQRPVENVCPSCKSIVHINYKFCAVCGAALLPPKPVMRRIVTPASVPAAAPHPKPEPAPASPPIPAALPAPPAAINSPEFSPTVTVEAFRASGVMNPADTVPDPEPSESTLEHPYMPIAPKPPLNVEPPKPNVLKIPPIPEPPPEPQVAAAPPVSPPMDLPPSPSITLPPSLPGPVKEPHAQTTDWKTLSIFVSSTFKDMSAEREYLAYNLFPKLRKELLQQKIQLTDFDPRLTAQPTSLKQSLDAISNCSVFIGLLGESYGRSMDYLPEDVIRSHPWLLKHSGYSQAGLEMMKALRRREKIQTLFYFRRPDFLNEVPDTSRSGYLSEDPWTAAKLSQLKQQIRDCVKVRDYSCKWNDGLTGFDDLGKDIHDALISIVEQPPQQVETVDLGAGDDVDCTVLSPLSISRGQTFFIKVSLQVRDLIDPSAPKQDPGQRRTYRSLESKITRGNQVGFQLDFAGIIIEPQSPSIIWKGVAESVQFSVTVPGNFEPGIVTGRVLVSQSSIPIGHVKFTLEVVEPGQKIQPLEPVGEEAIAYRMAFVSCASQDRDLVLERLKILPKLGIRYFQDVVQLDPASRWDKKLQAYIDHCDLFLLFWSNAAKESEHVRMEVNQALTRKSSNDSTLQIHPVPLDGSAGVSPWPELAANPEFSRITAPA